MIINRNQRKYIIDSLKEPKKFSTKQHKTLRRKMNILEEDLRLFTMYVIIYGDENDLTRLTEIASLFDEIYEI